jgi:hypothetical protein
MARVDFNRADCATDNELFIIGYDESTTSAEPRKIIQFSRCWVRSSHNSSLTMAYKGAYFCTNHPGMRKVAETC